MTASKEEAIEQRNAAEQALAMMDSEHDSLISDYVDQQQGLAHAVRLLEKVQRGLADSTWDIEVADFLAHIHIKEKRMPEVPTLPVAQLRDELSTIIGHVENGQVYRITRYGKVIAYLVPYKMYETLPEFVGEPLK